ncbi:TPA: glycerophosphodiester phosphodiesterase [Candidatus Ventrenecus avicola]|nr:glycerophosphodiester phosphodiesterase [Candidatus Ventrenecus avicola]
MKPFIAHRGLKKTAKENTISAFLDAIQSPYYAGFECDVRTTKDHVFVIVHDAIVGMKRVRDMTYSELKKNYAIPSLESVLNLQTDKIMLLEIKESDFDVPKFLKLLRKYSEKNLYVMSFFNSVIQRLAAMNCPCKLGVLNYVLNSEEDYQEYQFICLLEAIVSPKLIQYFTEKHMEVFLYGIHHFEKTKELYPQTYLITDEIIES